MQKGGAAPDASSQTSPQPNVSQSSVPPPPVSMEKNMENEMSTAGKFLGLDLNKQERIVKKIYEDYDKYYGKGGYGGESIDEVDGGKFVDGIQYDSKGRKVERLGILGKLYLNLDIANNKYGFPYDLQQDGRKTYLSDGTVIQNPVYNDGVLFSDDASYNPVVEMSTLRI